MVSASSKKEMKQSFTNVAKFLSGVLVGVAMLKFGFGERDAIAAAAGIPLIVGFFVD
jgi:uncharacterized membrane protein YjjP (DUF1212 family)